MVGRTDAASMRVLLHNSETQLYYVGADQWTNDAALTLDFHSIQGAVDLYKQGRVAFAEIVLMEGPQVGRIPFGLPDDPQAAAA